MRRYPVQLHLPRQTMLNFYHALYPCSAYIGKLDMLFASGESPPPRGSFYETIYPSPKCAWFTYPYFDRLARFRCRETRKCQVSTPYMTHPGKNAKSLSKPSVIFITPNNVCQNIEAAVQLVKTVLTGGTSLVQVRDMNSTPSQVKRLIRALLTGGVPAPKIAVNGMNPNEVMAVNCRLGVHIKEKDILKLLPVAKEVMPPSGIIGCAVHSMQAAKQVVGIHEPSYLQVGTMYPTQSHPGKIPEGPGLVAQIRNVVGSTTLIGVGGIHEENIVSVFEHGADGIAVITQLSKAHDPQTKAASLLKLCEAAYEAKGRGQGHK